MPRVGPRRHTPPARRARPPRGLPAGANRANFLCRVSSAHAATRLPLQLIGYFLIISPPSELVQHRKAPSNSAISMYIRIPFETTSFSYSLYRSRYLHFSCTYYDCLCHLFSVNFSTISVTFSIAASSWVNRSLNSFGKVPLFHFLTS